MRLIDVLTEEALLVFELEDASPSLQADQHGDARRRTRALCELPAFTDDVDNNAALPTQAALALQQAVD